MFDRTTTHLILILTVCVVIDRTNGKCATKYMKFPGHTACRSPAENAIPQELSAEDIKKLESVHNEMRSYVDPPAANMMTLSWDTEIAMIAQTWANTCPITEGRIAQDEPYLRFIPGRFTLGQTTYLVSEAGIDGGIVEDWYSEFNSLQSGGKAPNYTQLVWATTVKFGCGYTMCDDSKILICNYGPRGNLPGMAPYINGTMGGEECMEKKEMSNACMCDNLECWNGQFLNTSTCECECDAMYKKPECSLKCDMDDPKSCSNYTKKDCSGMKAPMVSSMCPNMCDICPYANFGYSEGEPSKEGGRAGETPKSVTEPMPAEKEEQQGESASGIQQMCYWLLFGALLLTR